MLSSLYQKKVLQQSTTSQPHKMTVICEIKSIVLLIRPIIRKWSKKNVVCVKLYIEADNIRIVIHKGQNSKVF